ncbi:MAG: hypothetical protein MAG451_00645 [Anaerolineales bacterium]|nr:hypothetical protein [Anaerolineales bacterium]
MLYACPVVMFRDALAMFGHRFGPNRIAALVMISLAALVLLGSGVQPAVAQTCTQAARNADFEAGADHWGTHSAAGSDLIVPEAAHQGQYGARLGGTDDVSLEVCSGGPPAISLLRMSSSVGGAGKEHFRDGVEHVSIAFAYDNIGAGDDVRLLIRNVNGTTLLDHTYGDLAGSGTRHVVFTARDAVDGLMRSALDAGNSATRDAGRVLKAESRFELAPYLQRAAVALNMLDNATRTLRKFEVGEPADAYLSQAQDRIDAASAAAQAALKPSIDLEALKTHVSVMRGEVQAAMVKVAEARATVAEARATVPGESLTFPETVDCQFNLTNIYLNEMPADSVQWTVGPSGPPARIHPPRDTRKSGTLHVRPLTIHTQQVASVGVPHETEIAGRVIDADCRPVADDTRVAFALDDASLGALVPDTVTTSDGYFATVLQATEDLGDGAVTVYAEAGDVEAEGVIFLVGPPATVNLDAEASTVDLGHSILIAAQVVDALGQAVADGTPVRFSLSPPPAGSITPATATTSNGFASAMFVAGDTAGRVTLRAATGDVEDVAVIEVVGVAPTPTPAPTATAEPVR